MVCLLVLAFALLAGPVVHALPQITEADTHVIPEGGTIHMIGSGFTGATTGHMMWSASDITASVSAVSDTELEVVMPNVIQDIRDYVFMVESPGGSTVGIHSEFLEHTTVGPLVGHSTHPTGIVVVRAGATLSGSVYSMFVYVETGGVLQIAGSGIKFLIVEDGGVVDFEGISSLSGTKLYHSPDSVIHGAIPSGVTTREIPSVRASYNIDTFTVGAALNLAMVGDGSISVTPDQPYHRLNEYVTLTATPDIGYTFSGWSGDVVSSSNPLTFRVDQQQYNITATFSPGWLLDLIEVPGVTVLVSPDMLTYPDGTAVTLTAQVDPGYELLGWGGDLTGTGLTNSFSMTDNTVALPVVRPLGYENLPQITEADTHVIPEGGTIHMTGSGFTGATTGHMMWGFWDSPASVSAVSDIELEVVMPNVAQDFRDYVFMVETPGGSTVGIHSEFLEHTTDGPLVGHSTHPTGIVVVRAGATLSGSVNSMFVYVEAGGVVQVAGSYIQYLIVEDGGVVDFEGVTSMSGIKFYHSPDSVILGGIPSGVIAREIPSVRASYNIGTFTVGAGLNIATVGDGSISVTPDQPYHPLDDDVTLTAIPGIGQTFSGWSGDVVSSSNPLTFRVRQQQYNITATFSPGWLLDLIEVPGVTVLVSPDMLTYPDGTAVTLTAQVDPGYELLGWAGDLSGTGLTNSFSITDNTLALPVVRPLGYEDLPQITGADTHAIPEGETIHMTGSGFTGATTGHMMWGLWDSPTSVSAVSDTELEVVMPDVPQDIRDYVFMVETPGGSTVGIHTEFLEHTTDGPLVGHSTHPTGIVVVRSGATLSGSVNSMFVYVEAGGVVQVAGSYIKFLIVEDGGVVDFEGGNSLSGIKFYHSPDSVILGAIPSGVITREIPSVRASYNIDTFTVGYPLNLVIEGPGSVTVSPLQDYYRANDMITLTAVPDPGAFFIRWIGPLADIQNPGTLRVRDGATQIARFSTQPGYYTDWRLRHFTNEELSDVTISALSADPDGDFLTNAAEYAFGGNPRVRDDKSKIRMTKQKVDETFHFFVIFPRPKNALDVTYTALLSSNLDVWNANGDETGILYSEVVDVQSLDEDLEEVTLRIYPDSAPPRTNFVKINALIFE